MRKRLPSLFLILVLILQLLPILSFAEETEEAPEEGKTVLSYIQDGDYLYFGEYQERTVKWKVLDADAMSTGEPGMFLFSEYMIQNDNVAFSGDDSTAWEKSDAQKWCKKFYTSGFSARELPLVAATTKKDSGGVYFTKTWKASELNNDNVFFLSAEEVAHYIGPNNGDSGISAVAYDGSIGFWWLRSPQGSKVGLAVSENTVTSDKVFKEWGTRPAINLQEQDVLFASAANDTADSGAIQVISETAEGEWKLTLSDANRLFEVVETHLRNGTLTVAYKGASVGEKEFTSALVCDADGQPYAYGRLVKPEQAAGEFSVSLADFTFPDGASLFLFSEQDNGVGKTDYAGALYQVMVTITFDPGDGTGEMEPLTLPLGGIPEITEPDFQSPYGMHFDRWAAEEGLLDEGMHAMQDGKITALYIPATAKEIALDKTAAVLPLSERITIHATVLPEDAMDTSIRWIGGDDIVKLTDNGDGSCTIEALSPGNTTVTAVSGDGRVSIEVPVTVTGTESMATISTYRNYLIAGAAALILLILFIRLLVRHIRIRRMRRYFEE